MSHGLPLLQRDLARLRKSTARRRHLRLAGLGLLLGLLFGLALMLGRAITPPLTLLRVLMGAEIPGVSFTVRELRLPRALLAALAGAAFGLGGAAFQTLLRNPLASPDIIGISAGAGTAAAIGIVFFGLSGAALSLVAVLAGLAVAALVALLAGGGRAAPARLVLTGIGLAAMAQSATAWALTQAPGWTRAEALRWLSGSVNGAQLEAALPLALALLLCGGALLAQGRALETLRLGEDMATALGLRPGRVRLRVLLAAVGLVSFATAATGPIAFAAFLAGPLAGFWVGRGGSILLPAALSGAVLVLSADLLGQGLLGPRLPVGVVTGVLGAPCLILLLLRRSRERR